MNSRLPILKRLQKILHIKPSPLRKGSNGPYIFIHITKTAGTSVGRAIGLSAKDHLTGKEIIAKIGKQKWESAYKFTVVRNPWDKVVSLYEYRRKKNKTKIASSGMTFTEWVKLTHGHARDPYYYNNIKSFQAQVEWLKDDQDEIAIDFIARFESLKSDFDKIKSATGIRADLPHLNASTRESYQNYYTDETRELVARWYQEDIDLFGYTFE